MADDKLRRGDRKPGGTAECGICDKFPDVRCPGCPREVPGRRTEDSRAWEKYRTRNPEEYRIDRACAVAARNLAITHESHHLYPEYLARYRDACNAREAFWAERRERLPKPHGTRLGAFASPAAAMGEALT